MDQCAGLLTQISPFISALHFDQGDKRQVRLCGESVRQFVIREWARGGPIQQPKRSYVVTRDEQQRIDERVTDFRATLRSVAMSLGYGDLAVWR